jgi:hypothetical protein
MVVQINPTTEPIPMAGLFTQPKMFFTNVGQLTAKISDHLLSNQTLSKSHVKQTSALPDLPLHDANRSLH